VRDVPDTEKVYILQITPSKRAILECSDVAQEIDFESKNTDQKNQLQLGIRGKNSFKSTLNWLINEFQETTSIDAHFAFTLRQKIPL
jgi:hypothetical protein